jgi:hypothetical protein
MIMKGSIPPNGKSCVDQDGNVVSCGGKSAVYSIFVTTNVPATLPANATLLNVRVTWPQSQKGVTSSIIVSRQGKF